MTPQFYKIISLHDKIKFLHDRMKSKAGDFRVILSCGLPLFYKIMPLSYKKTSPFYKMTLQFYRIVALHDKIKVLHNRIVALQDKIKVLHDRMRLKACDFRVKLGNGSHCFYKILFLHDKIGLKVCDFESWLSDLRRSNCFFSHSYGCYWMANWMARFLLNDKKKFYIFIIYWH